MSNVFTVTDLVLKESLRIAHEKLSFISTVDRQYDESFRWNGRTGPTGQTIKVRSPNQYTRRTGSRVMDVQDQAEATQTITLATQDGVDMRFNSQELIQSVNNDGAFDDLSRNYIEPAVAALCSGVENDFIAYCTKLTHNVVGTAGTAITDLSVVGQARARLNQNVAPKDGNRVVMMDSVTMGGMVNGLKGLFHDSAQLKEAFREGFIGRTSMADYYENDRMWTLPNSADVAAEVDGGTLTSGITTIHMDGLSAAPVAGMVFTVAGTFAVHPETKSALPHLAQWTVVSATSTGGTDYDIVFSPAMIHSTTDPAQNCSGAPTNDDAVTFVGALSTNYVQPIMYHKEAFQFVTADLPIVDDAHKCVRRMKDGLSMRAWMGSDIRNDELLLRLDILYGMAALRPQWACRMIGAANT